MLMVFFSHFSFRLESVIMIFLVFSFLVSVLYLFHSHLFQDFKNILYNITFT